MLDLPCPPTSQIKSLLRPSSWSRAQRLLVGLVLPVMAVAVSLAVRSQTAPPAIPQVSLSSDPLYATTSGDKPTMALALFQRNSELTSAANSLVASLAAARGEAMKTGMQAMVVPADGSSWSSGWVVFLDKDRNQALTESADRVIFRQAAMPSHLSVDATGTASATPPYILFDGSGYSKTKAGGISQLTFSIARNDVAESTRWDQTRRVMISTAGRIRSCRPASASDDTCSAPTNPDD